MNLKDKYANIEIKTLEDLKKIKSDFFGPNSELKQIQSQMKNATKEQKIELGKKIKILKNEADCFFIDISNKIENKKIEEKIKNEWIDVTKPVESEGSLHPLTLVSNRFREWFIQNGYFESLGSEIETDEYNFEKLNINEDHPARDMQDSLYINKLKLMRTHNTGFTARELEKNINKSFSHFAIGNVYRNDDDDQTHSHQFSQVDFVAVGNYSFPNLIWTLKSVLSYVLEQEVELRLRPSYFPFTEPSVEVDIKFNEKWMEVLGAGMLNTNVFKACGYTNSMNGFAAGIGIERITMMKYGIEDIRVLYKNDIRFLKQFKGGE